MRPKILNAAKALAGSPRIAAITGAGVSTFSGIPDYRSPGRPPHRPLMHSEFLSSERNRQRYWVRATLGFEAVANARPNSAHFEVARLARVGIVTQNVDGLHLHPQVAAEARHRSGNGVQPPVVELHGTLHRVHCADGSCGATEDRDSFQSRFHAVNPLLEDIIEGSGPNAKGSQGQPDDVGGVEVTGRGGNLSTAACASGSSNGNGRHDTRGGDGRSGDGSRRPDGDVEIETMSPRLLGFLPQVSVPACASCGGGPVQPSVVFFGASVEEQVRRKAEEIVAGDACDSVLVVGTTLSTYSARRLVKMAKDAGKTTVLINNTADIAPSASSDLFDHTLEGEVGGTLGALRRSIDQLSG